MAAAITSILFVPATRLDRVASARAAAPDLICVDLEDSVPADAKADARAAVLGVADVAIRINGLRTREGIADLLALAAAPPPVVLVPMVECADEIAIVRGTLGAVAVIPLIETLRGLDAAAAIAAAPGVAAVMLGGADLAAELGVALAWEPLLVARSRLVMATAAARVPAIDVPWTDLDDLDGLAAEAARAKALGYAGKAAIHPKHLPAIRAAFAPSPAEIDEARAAIAAFHAGGGAAIRFRGRMLEGPLMARYRRIAGQE